MSKELPYFQFVTSEWITGDITLCDLETQGLFVNMIAYYWEKSCTMTLANAKQRFSKHEALLNNLLNQNIIKIDKDDNIIINFLDEQMNQFINVSEKRAIAGRKGGLAKAKQLLSKAKAKRSNKEKRREEKRREEIDKKSLSKFDKALLEFESMRKEKKKPLTKRAKEMILNKLSELSKDQDTQIKILEQSILHNWDSVYGLKSNNKQYNRFNQKLDTKELYEKNQRIVLE